MQLSGAMNLAPRSCGPHACIRTPNRLLAAKAVPVGRRAMTLILLANFITAVESAVHSSTTELTEAGTRASHRSLPQLALGEIDGELTTMDRSPKRPKDRNLASRHLKQHAILLRTSITGLTEAATGASYLTPVLAPTGLAGTEKERMTMARSPKDPKMECLSPGISINTLRYYNP